MHIKVDLATCPPNCTLEERGAFSSFKVVVIGTEHTWVGADTLKSLAGEAGKDAAWQAELDRMLEFARTKGWMNQRGEIRAHVQLEPSGSPATGGAVPP